MLFVICCRDNSSLQLSDIQGGLIFVKKYTVRATAENELVSLTIPLD